MAAPGTTTRTTPGGTMLHTGHGIKITFAADANIEFAEKQIKPPSLEGGDAIETTNQFRGTVRTFRPRALKLVGNITGSVQYDPAYLSNIFAAVNREDTISVVYPDGVGFAAYGFLMKFDPQQMEDGEEPLADIEIQISSWDSTNGVEASPLFGSDV